MTKPISPDWRPVDFSRLTACPKCEASWQGDLIPKKSRSLFGNAEWFSRVICISSMREDRAIAWQCPDCNACWDRTTGKPRESFDLAGVRGLS